MHRVITENSLFLFLKAVFFFLQTTTFPHFQCHHNFLVIVHELILVKDELVVTVCECIVFMTVKS